MEKTEQSRGQPENAGQFGPGGGGGGGGAEPAAEKKAGGSAAPAAPAGPFAYPAGYKPPSPNSAPSDKLPRAAQPDLDAGEAKALDWYAADGYRALNAALYQGSDLTWSKAGIEGVAASVMGGRGLGGRPKATHERLQQAFAKAEPFAEPVAVARGLSFPDDKAKAAYVARFEQAAASGGVVKLAGYQSTTVGGGTVGTFENSSVTLEIDAVHGLDVGPYSLYHHESELLLDHDSAFSVKKIERDHLGRVTIRLEQMLPPPKKTTRPLTEATIMSDENEDDLPQEDPKTAAEPTKDPAEAFRERVAGSAPPPDSVRPLTPEEAAAAGYRRHPRAKD